MPSLLHNSYFCTFFHHLYILTNFLVIERHPYILTIFLAIKRDLPDLQKDLVHDEDGFLSEVRSAGGDEGEHVIRQVSGEVRGHETGQPIQSEAGIVEVRGRNVFSDHVGSQHYHVHSVVETLCGC